MLFQPIYMAIILARSTATGFLSWETLYMYDSLHGKWVKSSMNIVKIYFKSCAHTHPHTNTYVETYVLTVTFISQFKADHRTSWVRGQERTESRFKRMLYLQALFIYPSFFLGSKQTPHFVCHDSAIQFVRHLNECFQMSYCNLDTTQPKCFSPLVPS